MSEYDPMEIVGDQVLNTAEWRRRKAQKFPEDNRNLEAAKELERLARETENLRGSAAVGDPRRSQGVQRFVLARGEVRDLPEFMAVDRGRAGWAGPKSDD